MVGTSGRITLWGIEVFAATAEERSITAAAERLGASPSAVSQQLTNLEAAVGTALLDRHARPVALTPAGETFRRHANAILTEAAEARAALAGTDMSHLTRLRLGVVEDFDADVTPRLLSEMAGTLRECRFLLETGASHRLYDLLESRALDMIVAADTGDAAPWMEVHPLLREPFVVAAPPGYVPQAEPEVQFDALSRLPLIHYTMRHFMGRQINAHMARHNLGLEHRFELDSYHAILAMVADGVGWTVLTPLGLLRAQRFLDDVDIVPAPFAPLHREISLVARQGVFRDMPQDVAAQLRRLLDELVIKPALARIPWAEGELVVL